ncbi:MAG: MAPEG family protein [Halorhodospira sp.]
MSLAYWMVLIAAVLPMLFAGAAKYGGGQFDNSRPREWLARQEGWPKRAHWAQQNGYEAFPPFAAGVIIAHQVGAAQGVIDTLAVLFVLLRLVYGLLYITDYANLRSLAWTAGFACVVGLFLAAAAA